MPLTPGIGACACMYVPLSLCVHVLEYLTLATTIDNLTVLNSKPAKHELLLLLVQVRPWPSPLTSLNKIHKNHTHRLVGTCVDAYLDIQPYSRVRICSR